MHDLISIPKSDLEIEIQKDEAAAAAL